MQQLVDHTLGGYPDGTLIKSISEQGYWYCTYGGTWSRFRLYRPDLLKAVKTKSYYSPEEVKARGMRWVTIRGARVLLQGTTDGGWVVVGGAGGKLSHMKIDKILTEEAYSAKKIKMDEKRKEDLRALTPEEKAEHKERRKAETSAKKEARQQYTTKVTEILGVTPDAIRSDITAKQMDELTIKARDLVESKAATKTMDAEAIEKEVEKVAQDEVEKEVRKKVKNVERQALETLMNDYMSDDPNAQPELKKLLDTDKALEVLAARKAFKKELKAIGKSSADIPTDLKVGAVFAGASSDDMDAIKQEVAAQIETQKNIRLYDTLNAQSSSIKKHIDAGAASALNGLVGDLYGVGATFSNDTLESLGVEATARAVAIKIQQDGNGSAIKSALEEYAANEREKVVTEALTETEKRFKNADALRALARDTDDAEAILSMASANGHALKQITAGQRTLGTAVGSLRAVAHLINALDEPPADVIQVDVGTDLTRARERADKAGLEKGTYKIKARETGRGKHRLVLELKKENLNTFFQNNKDRCESQDLVTRIKSHKENNGYIPPGIKKSIELASAQEAGLRFFNEKDKVLLDFEAGLGKTPVAYAAAMEAIHNKGAKKVLIVTPASLRDQMYDERKIFLDEENQKNVCVATAGTYKRKRLAMYEKEGVLIIGHDQLRSDSEFIKNAGFDMVVVDEMHEMTAGTGKSGRYKGMMNLKDIPLKIGMSGTNIKNKKEELYRKINFLDPEHTMGTMTDFSKRYKGLNQGTGMFADAANDAFRKETSEQVFTQKAMLDVKNTTERFKVPLTAGQRTRYAASERTYQEERFKKLKGAAARRDSRNYQIVTNGESMDNGKLNQIVDTMKTKHSEEKAVIHVYGLNAVATAKARLEKDFGSGCVGVINGSSSPKEIRDAKAAFNDTDNPLRFIVGTKSLEAGHNLQAGGTVTFHLDIPESYAGLEQRNKRVHRRGQTKDTSTYILSGDNPLDMRREDLLETKRREMGIMGNPREVVDMDGTGFLSLLNKHEAEARGEVA